MHGYDSFFDDVRKIFSNIIINKNADFNTKGDPNFGQYAVELVFKKSKLILDLDRMDLQCTLVNLDNGNKYYVKRIIKVLYPNLKLIYPDNGNIESHKTVIRYLDFYSELIENYLLDVIDGDFSWSKDYDEKENYESEMVNKVLKLNYNDEIQQKFWKGDPTWVEDLKKRLE